MYPSAQCLEWTSVYVESTSESLVSSRARTRKAAICARVTLLVAQKYRLVHPMVIPRSTNFSTYPQAQWLLGTSLKRVVRIAVFEMGSSPIARTKNMAICARVVNERGQYLLPVLHPLLTPIVFSNSMEY